MNNKLSITEFGQQLLIIKDLDPVYVILQEAQMESELLQRWLLAYWCFYHCGTASWICDGAYWNRMEAAAGSKEYPRSAERRHFRGVNATSSIDWLKRRGMPSLFQPLIGVDVELREITAHVRSWVGFGPWIAFKVADMVERLGLSRVKFDEGAMFLFDSPREGAELAWEHYGKGDTKPNPVGPWAVRYVLKGLKGKAPPRYERPLNEQEAETVLCKWKSYMGGRYHVGEDIGATRRGLMKFARCKTSQRLLAAGKKGGLW